MTTPNGQNFGRNFGNCVLGVRAIFWVVNAVFCTKHSLGVLPPKTRWTRRRCARARKRKHVRTFNWQFDSYGPATANLRTKIMDFGGLDSSRLLSLRGGIPRPIGNFQSSNLSRDNLSREIERIGARVRRQTPEPLWCTLI